MKFKRLYLLIIMSVLVFSGCSGASQADKQKLASTAGPVVDNLMQGLNEGNFEKFSQDFDDTMKKSFTGAAFKETDDLIKQKIGNYVSKSFWKTQKNGRYTVFFYRCKFDNEPDEVLATISIDLTGSKPLVGGFYLNSPKLLKK